MVLPALQRFRPQFIVVASGLDASAMDPLGRMLCTSETYRAMAARMVGAADSLCAGRLVTRPINVETASVNGRIVSKSTANAAPILCHSSLRTSATAARNGWRRRRSCRVTKLTPPPTKSSLIRQSRISEYPRGLD